MSHALLEQIHIINMFYEDRGRCVSLRAGLEPSFLGVKYTLRSAALIFSDVDESHARRRTFICI